MSLDKSLQKDDNLNVAKLIPLMYLFSYQKGFFILF